MCPQTPSSDAKLRTHRGLDGRRLNGEGGRRDGQNRAVRIKKGQIKCINEQAYTNGYFQQ